MKILVTGGCGFVGSNLAIALKEKYANYEITCLDNLKRRGSELSVNRLQQFGIKFQHGDIRLSGDLDDLGEFDLIIEAAAEPSAIAGTSGSSDYLISTNLNGTVNCLELAKDRNADFIFLSTSRVYPIAPLEKAEFYETESRFEWSEHQNIVGLSREGVSESFPLAGARSLYGTTKLCSELLIEEYRTLYDFRTVINRCGVIAGPYQMGKVDQGMVALWVARHLWGKELTYIGYGGSGKQVRDILHIRDLFALLDWQIHHFDQVNGETFNVGGGRDCSVSLMELTDLCKKLTGNEIEVTKSTNSRVGDIRIYLTDHRKITALSGWTPKHTPSNIIEETIDWMKQEEEVIRPILT